MENFEKVKNDYKDLLTEFYVPEPSKTYKSLIFVYTIQRHTKQRIDSDSIALITKWLTDIFTKCGWLIDDDKVTHIFKPAEQDLESVETQLRFQIYETK